VKESEGQDQSEDVEGRIILQWSFKKYDGRVWTGLIWLNRDKWRPSVNSIMNLGFHEGRGIC
jgi:hypothetical protein